MEIIRFALAVIVGFVVFTLLTHPQSVIWNSFPEFKSKRVQIFPSLRFFIFNRTIHFHHWFNLAIALVISIFISGTILNSSITKGMLLGGMLQGLSMKHARKVVYKTTEAHQYYLKGDRNPTSL